MPNKSNTPICEKEAVVNSVMPLVKKNTI